jgi:hypothetical protein
MPSLDETFDALLEHLRHPDFLNPARSDPFFYFVHSPSETLQVKQKLPVWSSVLRNEGWVVDEVSLGKLVWNIVAQSGRWEEWLDLEPNAGRLCPSPLLPRSCPRSRTARQYQGADGPLLPGSAIGPVWASLPWFLSI